jgi:hypothetical protein
MSEKLCNVKIIGEDDDSGRVHLPNDYRSTAGFHTLCGWCDVRCENTDEPANCPTCIAALEHARRVWLARKRLVSEDLP